MKLSKRKLESYRRAEIVAQATRLVLVHQTQDNIDLWHGALRDWMRVTGKLKYDAPKRRGRQSL